VQIIYELSVGHERLEVSDSVLFNSGGSALMRCPLPPPEHALTAASSHSLNPKPCMPLRPPHMSVVEKQLCTCACGSACSAWAHGMMHAVKEVIWGGYLKGDI